MKRIGARNDKKGLGVGTGEARLREAIRRFNATRRNGVRLEERPPAVYCLLTREDLDDLIQEFKELKGTIRNIYVSVLLVVIGVVVDLVLRSVGAK